MDRSKIAAKLIKYLEERINCENVIKFAQETNDSLLGKGLESEVDKLIIESVPIAFKIIKYNDEENYIKESETDANDRTWLKNLFDTFDFMTDANHTGFEYFPYLYGVLNCHEGENSKVYIFYEAFEGNLIKLINQMEHPSEWYDIVFQMIMINYYIEVLNGYLYNYGTPQNHLYRRLPKAIYREYELGDFKFKINHKYLIVLWDFNFMEKITDENRDKIVANTTYLLNYINANKDKLKIPPSGRIIKLLYDVQNHSKEIPSILNQYYNIQK